MLVAKRVDDKFEVILEVLSILVKFFLDIVYLLP